MLKPAVTYVVSAFDRPRALRCVLASLQLQTDENFEVIVADNGRGIDNLNTVEQFDDDPRFIWHDTRNNSIPSWDCYWSAEKAVERYAKGEWLVFPSDDSYYVPVFQEAMLSHARANDLQLVYCDMLYDRRFMGRYSVMPARPSVGGIDKTSFMVRRDVWIGFPSKPQGPVPTSSCADGEMIETLVKRGVRHGRVEEVLVVHN